MPVDVLMPNPGEHASELLPAALIQLRNLSIDQRLVDGAEAARFLQNFADKTETPNFL